MKVVIANSVGITGEGRKVIHFPSRWTATLPPPGGFTYYPYELAYLSTLLKRETDFDIKMVDGNLLDLNADQYIDLLLQEKPDWLVMETATVIYRDDLKVALALKEKLGTKLVFTGAHPTGFPEEVLNDGVDYVAMGEYEAAVLDLIRGEDSSKIEGIYPNGYRELLDLDWLPFPEDEDISRADYNQVEGCDYNEIELFPTRGCPLKCNFCVCGNLYYKKPLWRSRNVDNVCREIKYITDKYPQIEGFFFDEEYHNFRKQYVIELSEAIIRHKLDHLKYDAMCGHWTLDEEVLDAMKAAGYYKVRMGIETVSDEVLKTMNKKVSIDRIADILRYAKKIGIKTYATFTFGALGATAKDDMKTVRFIKTALDEGILDDIQTSICTPQPGTPFYKISMEKGYLSDTNYLDFDGEKMPVVSYPEYSCDEILEVFSTVRDTISSHAAMKAVKQEGYLSFIGRKLKTDGLTGLVSSAVNYGLKKIKGDMKIKE